MSKLSLILVLSLLLTGSAAASPITTLCDTGSDSACNVLFTLGGIDPNYKLMQDPDGALADPANAYMVSNDAWKTPGGSAQWIQPTYGTDLAPVKNGTYVYQTSFVLDPVFYDVRIAGTWMADNAGVEIRLNGNPIPGTGFPWLGVSDVSGFQQAHDFKIYQSSLPAGVALVPGLNTLDFVITNGLQENGDWYMADQDHPQGADNPSGLRVNFTEKTFSSVPEPAASILVGGALLGLGALLKRRKRA